MKVVGAAEFTLGNGRPLTAIISSALGLSIITTAAVLMTSTATVSPSLSSIRYAASAVSITLAQ